MASRNPRVAGSVVAGFPSPAEQYLEPPLDLNELLVKRPAATFFVRVEGDSMIGAGIRDKDLLVVDRSLTPANGDIIIASVDGEFTHGKRIVKDAPRTFDGLREYLRTHNIEGLVFWKDGEPQCKIKRSDFGFKWPDKTLRVEF